MADYFKKMPKILYDFRVNGSNKLTLVKDITTNVRFRGELLSNITLYDEYDIEDGETPEIIAAKIYGNPKYHWVIMLANQRYDYLADFPLSTDELETFIGYKYGEDNKYDTAHYEDENGFVVNSDTPGAVPISNYEVEERYNESKRRIKIINPNLLNQILEDYKDLI